MYWRRTWLSTPVLLPGESHGQRSLAGYSPWGRTESDMIERASQQWHWCNGLWYPMVPLWYPRVSAGETSKRPECREKQRDRTVVHLPGNIFNREIHFFFSFFFFVVNFVIHWNETAMGLHVFPIPIPPPTSLSTRSP